MTTKTKPKTSHIDQALAIHAIVAKIATDRLRWVASGESGNLDYENANDRWKRSLFVSKADKISGIKPRIVSVSVRNSMAMVQWSIDVESRFSEPVDVANVPPNAMAEVLKRAYEKRNELIVEDGRIVGARISTPCIGLCRPAFKLRLWAFPGEVQRLETYLGLESIEPKTKTIII